MWLRHLSHSQKSLISMVALEFDMTMQLHRNLPSWISSSVNMILASNSDSHLQIQTSVSNHSVRLLHIFFSQQNFAKEEKKQTHTEADINFCTVGMWLSLYWIGFYSKNHEQIAWSDYLIFWELMWVNTCSSSERVARLHPNIQVAEYKNHWIWLAVEFKFHIQHDISNMKLSKNSGNSFRIRFYLYVHSLTAHPMSFAWTQKTIS